MQGRTKKIASGVLAGLFGAVGVAHVSAQSLTTYGTPGLIELPTAEVLNDGDLAFSASVFGPNIRYNGTFQVLPRVYGTFRYSKIDGFDPNTSSLGGDRFDRSFDIHYQISDETKNRPAFAVGMRDFLGTGILSSEYFVATKSFGSKLEVTGGLGWGRLAGRNSFSNPFSLISDRFDTRKKGSNTGGQLESGNWFRGPTSPFAGVKWKYSDRTTLFAEYSPDVYARESVNTGIDVSSPLNVGLEYRLKNGVNLKGFVIGGQEVGAQVSYVINAKKPRFAGGIETAPRSVGNRNRLAVASWNNSAEGGGLKSAERVLKARLAEEGLSLHAFTMAGTQATVQVENTQWSNEAQAAGRAARAMANTLPPAIEQLTVVFVERGVPISRIITQRSDLEDLQYDLDGSWRSLARARIEDAHDQGRVGQLSDFYPVFDTSFGPYVATSFFDPDSPIRADFGAKLELAYRPAPGLTFAGVFRYPLIGNIEKSNRVSNSKIEPVRTNAIRYAQESDFEIGNLTAEYLFRPGKDLFGRVSAGYLENMFGGISTEVLWYPVEGRLALGAELNYVKQRDFDMLFGFQDYSVVTGHASAYYDLGNGFYSQLDVGRYLAGDYGATVSIDREFNNGFKVGGYFTLTDVSFDDFGEGSFDKGLRFEIPVSWFTGRPSRKSITQSFNPVTRDGGARLNVENRLHGVVRDYRGKELSDSWGRYLR